MNEWLLADRCLQAVALGQRHVLRINVHAALLPGFFAPDNVKRLRIFMRAEHRLATLAHNGDRLAMGVFDLGAKR